MAIISKVVNFFDKKPGTVAIIGAMGVILSSLVDIGQILLYTSVGIGIIGFLIYSDRKTVKSKRTKKLVKNNKDYIL